MILNEIELQIMENSRNRSTGGIDLFWMYWSAPIGATEDQARMDLIGMPPDEYNPPLNGNEFVPVSVLPWAEDIAHSPDSDFIIIGGVGCGKTLNMVLVAGYYCCMMPNFRYLGTAPISWQADLSYREFLSFALDWDNQGGRPRRISKWIKNVRKRPYPTIEFVNGSTMEFKSLDGDAAGIMTWSGDMAVVDQAESDEIDLETVVGNLGTRLRGQVGGRARLGKLGLMANSAYNPILWSIYDSYESEGEQTAIILTSYDNPYLTKKQLRDIKRRFRDKDEAERLMKSERPLPKGKEFTKRRITNCQSVALDAFMDDALREDKPGFIVESTKLAGITRWIIPPNKDHSYIMAGDPGQGNPPFRNSPCACVFDVTNFPKEPATLAAFDWIYGYGSYSPFISRMDSFYTSYNPYIAGFDSTGTQKAFDDLGILDQNKIWMPLDMSGQKMHMVLCLKVLMDRGMIKIPKSLNSVWNQLLMWCMPDKNLQQDISSTLFMIGYILNQLLPMPVEENDEIEDTRVIKEDRWNSGRYHSQRSMRSTKR